MMHVHEVATVLGVHVDTVRRYDNQGKLRAKKRDRYGYRLYSEADVQAFIRKRDRVWKKKWGSDR